MVERLTVWAKEKTRSYNQVFLNIQFESGCTCLFNRNRLGQIAWLVHIFAQVISD
jgi:hypothetical protein